VAGHAAAIAGSAVVHSRLIQRRGLGLLLAEKSGGRKSSLGLFSLLAGARLVSDDMMVISRDRRGFSGRAFRAYSLLRTATRDALPDDLRRLTTRVDTQEGVKHLLMLEHLGARGPVQPHRCAGTAWDRGDSAGFQGAIHAEPRQPIGSGLPAAALSGRERLPARSAGGLPSPAFCWNSPRRCPASKRRWVRAFWPSLDAAPGDCSMPCHTAWAGDERRAGHAAGLASPRNRPTALAVGPARTDR